MAASPRFKLIALDIDGTLLTSTAMLTQRTKDAVQRARASGMLITIATGRRYVTAAPIVAALDIAGPVILQTGALVVDFPNLRIIDTNPLPQGVARLAIDILVAGGVQPIIFENSVRGQKLYTGPAEFDSRGARQYFSGNPELVKRKPYRQLVPPDNALQLAAIDDLAVLENIAPHLTLTGCRTLISYSGTLDSYFMEIFHASCSKGAALERLAVQYGLSMAQVVAVGDNLNDLEMVQMAGLGVAMGNAILEIQEIADLVTLSNDEDGVAAIIDHLLSHQEVNSTLLPHEPIILPAGSDPDMAGDTLNVSY